MKTAMKKFLSILLVFAIFFSVTACRDSKLTPEYSKKTSAKSEESFIKAYRAVSRLKLGSFEDELKAAGNSGYSGSSLSMQYTIGDLLYDMDDANVPAELYLMISRIYDYYFSAIILILEEKEAELDARSKFGTLFETKYSPSVIRANEYSSLKGSFEDALEKAKEAFK